MNKKITELSSLISTDKDIQQKVSQLYVFKTKTEEEFLSKNLIIKNITKELKDAINNYDKILSNSVIYPSVIGYNSKFTNFHELIDFILLNITQFCTYKEKTNYDFRSYKNKIETLVKSFKLQADSIMSNTMEFTNSKIDSFEKKFQNLIEEQDSKIFNLKIENNKTGMALENKIDKLNNETKKMLEIKVEMYKKFDEEVKLLKNFNKIVIKKFENYQNEFKIIKNRFTTLSEFIKDVSLRLNVGELPQKKEMNIISEKHRIPRTSSQLVRNGMLAKSIVKKYIEGELNLNDIEHPLKKKKTNFYENDFNINLNSYNKSKSLSLNKYTKRMTFGPEKLRSLKRLQKSFVNKHTDHSIYSDKSLNNKTNTNNSISEEKSEEFDYINKFQENNDKTNKEINNNSKKVKIKETNKDNNNNDNDFSKLYEDVDISEENNPLKKIKENDVDKQNNKNDSIINTSVININQKKDNNNLLIKNITKKNASTKTNNTSKDKIINDNKETKETKENKTLSNFYRSNNNNNSFPKIINNNNNNIDKDLFQKKLMNKIQYKNQSQSFINKIEDNNNSLLNNNSNKKYTKTSIGIPDTYYNNYKNASFVNKLNIVEINFNKTNSFVNQKNKLKKIINNIKEGKINILSERNNKINEKLNYFKKPKDNISDVNLGNKSLGKIVINNNIGDNYYYSMMVKDDLQNNNNNNSFGYLNYIKKNKINIEKTKINLKKYKFNNIDE